MKSVEMLSIVMQEEVDKAVDSIKKGLVILYPTDTVWGLGCDIENSASVKRVAEIKNEDEQGSFVILVDSIELLKRYVASLHPRIETLLMHHKSPLTIVHDNPVNLPDYLINSNGSVAIRITHDEFCKSIISKFGRPILATSASTIGEPIPVNFEQISSEIIKDSDYIVQWRRMESDERLPSVMAHYNKKGELEFIRK